MITGRTAADLDRRYLPTAGNVGRAIAGGQAHVESAMWSLWVAMGASAVLVNRLDGIGCPFHHATGLDCPACGGTRALFNLLHGRLVNALHYNIMAVVLGAFLIPIAVLRHFGWAVPSWITASAVNRHRGATALTVMLVWTVFRNLDAFAWFSTSWATK